MTRNAAGSRPRTGTSPEPGPLRGRRLWARWFIFVTTGEFLGFSIPAVAGAATARAGAGIAVPVILAAGAVEGTLLGLAQAHVLRSALPTLSARRWVGATAAGAVVAYAIGMVPSAAADHVRAWPPVALALSGIVLGLILLMSIGTAQWLVLRTAARRTARWIVTTAVAWSVGLGVFLGFAMPLWHPGQPVAAVAGIGLAGGLLMAATTAALTGEALRRLLDRQSARTTSETARRGVGWPGVP